MRLKIADLIGASQDEAASWFDGSGVPDSSIGVTCDYYLDTVSSAIYKKSESGWTMIASVEGMQGADGADGSTWYAGESTGDRQEWNGARFLDGRIDLKIPVDLVVEDSYTDYALVEIDDVTLAGNPFPFVEASASGLWVNSDGFFTSGEGEAIWITWDEIAGAMGYNVYARCYDWDIGDYVVSTIATGMIGTSFTAGDEQLAMLPNGRYYYFTATALVDDEESDYGPWNDNSGSQPGSGIYFNSGSGG